MASLHTGEEEHAARELAKSAGLDSVWLGAEPYSADSWGWIDGTQFKDTIDRSKSRAVNTSTTETLAVVEPPGDPSDRLNLRMTDHGWHKESKAGGSAKVQHGVLCANRGRADGIESVKTFQ